MSPEPISTSTLYKTALSTLSLTPPTQLSPSPSPSPSPPPSKLIPNTRFIIDFFRTTHPSFSHSYFLSHFHSDHYSGLSPHWSSGIIYCSPLTSSLLTTSLLVPSPFIFSLPLNTTLIIDGVQVTLIDANHCPGAVQFLFKLPINNAKFEKYVHTGDFRYCESMRLGQDGNLLSDFVGCDAVFLDTTYCDPKFVFPSQDEAIEYVVSVVEKEKERERDERGRVLFLVATYVIGKERVLVEVARRCGCKVYVDRRKREILRVLGFGDGNIFTEDESATNVHVLGWNVLGETWPYFRPNFGRMQEIMEEKGYERVVGFVPTGWTYEVKKNKFAVRKKGVFEIHLVPYSEHSNYEELREFVRFLKPKSVVPTVGVDVENMDSKCVDKMRKHFVGLVDEMANKHEFLKGFHRVAQGKGDGDGETELVDLTIDLDEGVGGGGLNEESEVSEVKIDLETSSEAAVCSSGSKEKRGLQESASLSDKEKQEIMLEFRDCLPGWVTEEQMLELIKMSGKNVVDAVSYFYEHETDFHEKSGNYLSSSLSVSESDCQPLVNPSPDESNSPKVKKLSDQSYKFPPLKPLTVSSSSPGKRRKSTENKRNKKAKVNSSVEASGVKQCTITKFFSKSTGVSLGSTPSPVSAKGTPDKRSLIVVPSVRSYEAEVEQFIQIVNGDKSIRSSAVKLIEKARGNIELALDMYYNDSEFLIGNNENKSDVSANLTCVGSAKPCYSNHDERERNVEQENRVYQSDQKPVPENVSVSYVSLPPEEYSPNEHACWKHGQPAPYIHLARTFALVEGEKGKIKATSILCNMFRSLLVLSPEDVLPSVYLCTNKIGADHENVCRN